MNEPKFLQSQRKLSSPATKALNDMLVYVDTLKNVIHNARALVNDPSMADRTSNPSMAELKATIAAHDQRFPECP